MTWKGESVPAAARITDMHTCPKVEPGPVPQVGGPTVTGEPTVIIGGQPAARLGDSLVAFGICRQFREFLMVEAKGMEGQLYFRFYDPWVL